MRPGRIAVEVKKPTGVLGWVASGEPMIWANAAAVSLSLIGVVGLLLLLAVRGFGHFWPADILSAHYSNGAESQVVLAEFVEAKQVSGQQLQEAGFDLLPQKPGYRRSLFKRGNRDFMGTDFVWLLDEQLSAREYPPRVMALERLDWGNFYGYLLTLEHDGKVVVDARTDDALAWQALQAAVIKMRGLRNQIRQIERSSIGAINYRMEQLRLEQRRLQLDGALTALARAEIANERARLDARYALLQAELAQLYAQVSLDTISARLADGRTVSLPLGKIVRAWRPNTMSLFDKTRFYLEKFWYFLTEDPREANTEGGVFPAIFGTVMMVLLMSVMVTPFGVIAAVYLREYATQGPVTRVIRIAVNNLAGVPSIVYGVFGLGFFVYFLGGELDQLFYPEALPAPTFGTPGLMWASLTLALLTLPVVIVATEEGLARIPRSVREGSLALGATRAETLWRLVLPMASPAMMTGLILAVARAAGEVAPLMLVGVVKLAPTLPVDGNFPYLHLDQKFMHLGFHIYDVGFQSPNVEAARPLVYATALLLVVIIALLNFTAVMLRNRLRERYKTLET